MHEPEAELENKLIEALVKIGYKYVAIKDEAALVANLKTQLEKHNNLTLSDKEFAQVLNHLNKGNIWDKAKILRDKMQLRRDKARLVSDGSDNISESVYIEFINQEGWCQNEFQVTNQVTIEGTYKNRYDVTILINGLPLAQIELKRRGLQLKEAFNQTNRYQRHSYGANDGDGRTPLFQYIQIFVISNGVNTKYYSNNAKQTFNQTFFWSDQNNKLITDLFAFTDVFLEPCHLSKMITRYVVLAEAKKILMVLRPYQYFAVETIIDRVKNTRTGGPNKNGYIWHTTGSGKTLTSFKASQVLMNQAGVHKVVFVVDRKDLDYQTTKEFNSFSDGSVDGTENTNKLVEQFTDDTKLIVTTIQKLHNAISKKQYLARMEKQKDKRIIFIFDECHRTQFGKTHGAIKGFFTNNQMFGFTGTPIFKDNAASYDGLKRTTKDLFEECLHKYVITDAIKDNNVLKFSVEYVGKYKQKTAGDPDTANEVDIEVEDIDTKELMESDVRIDKISDYIIENHDRKTHSKAYTGMFCVSSIDILTKYYDVFAKKKAEGKHHLRIATIFSYAANEDDKDANGMFDFEEIDTVDFSRVAEPSAQYKTVNIHSREKLDSYIADYNKIFGTKHSTKDSQAFYNYYNEISKRVRNREVDILIVVNMFLTGFDSPTLSTLYVDKNLKHHGLIQAFSRTNRILDEKKSHGNIVCFRNLKAATDDAITLFSNKNAIEEIILKPYADYVARFNQVYKDLLAVVPTIGSVDDLPSEIEQLEFIKHFRELIKIKNVLGTFADFKEEDLQIPEQDYEDYKSKYLDLHDKVKTSTQKEKVSILEDVDFELELIHRDEINVAYILALLVKLKTATQAEQDKKRREITELLEGQVQLRSKRKLIEKFINENIPNITDTDQVENEFEEFWNIEREKALSELCETEKIDNEKLRNVVSEYLFAQRLPLTADIDNMLEVKPKLLERKAVFARIKDKINEFINTFIEGV